MRQDYKAQNRYIRAQNRYIRNNTYTPYNSPTPAYNPYYVNPYPGATLTQAAYPRPTLGTYLATPDLLWTPAQVSNWTYPGDLGR